MITSVLLSSQGEWTGRLRKLLGKHAAVFELDPTLAGSIALGRLPIDLIIQEDEYLTEGGMEALQQLRAGHPESVTVCVAAEEAAERVRSRRELQPDFWVIVPASDLQLQAQIEAIVALVEERSLRGTNSCSPQSSLANEGMAVVNQDAGGGRPESALYRMVGRMSGSFDIQQLLSAYCDAVLEMTQCVSYCLLWRPSDAQEYCVARSEGLHSSLHQLCRLSLADPLPNWLQRSRGIVWRDTLLEAPDRAPALRELDMCGGVMAIPLLCEGLLQGMMIVGPKAVGTPYLVSEAEALFVLSANTASAARQAELHRELEARNGYIDQVVLTMESGIVTIGLDQNICVCNPCAARILNLDAHNIIGRDLRALPSPLGDYLYGCLEHGEERSREVLSVHGGQANLRISTRRLSAPHGELMGSMLILEDVTPERILAEERRNAERNEIINQVVARFAHELKNPLATIHTFAELLPTRSDDPEFKEFWSEHVKRDVRRLDDLVVKLVSLAEQPTSNRSLVELADVVQAGVARLAMLDEDAASRVVLRLKDGLPPVLVDTAVMGTALSHLLRYGVSQQAKAVTVTAEVGTGDSRSQPVSLFIRANVQYSQCDDPQRLLDPSYVLDHPDIDLGPSASQRLIESQGGVLKAYHDGDDIVFDVRLLSTEYHSQGGIVATMGDLSGPRPAEHKTGGAV